MKMRIDWLVISVLTSTSKSDPTATRTRDLLLRRHFRSVAEHRRTWPDVPLGLIGSGCMCLVEPAICGRWLPFWLPGIPLATLMFGCPGLMSHRAASPATAGPAAFS
jgi:hypothetical protein